MNIEPQYTLPLVYQLTDPSDSNTYYIRAVIRNSLTGATLFTQNLVSQGSGRYTSSIQAPQDPTGQGLHIDVTITVYTDSGYSVLSDVYRREMTNYLVKRLSPLSFGGGSGVDIDYDKIRKIAREEARAAQDEVDTQPILDAVKAVEEKINAIEIPEAEEFPEQKPVDFTPVMEAFANLEAHITNERKSIEFPAQKEVDLSPVLTLIKDVLTGQKSASDLSAESRIELKNFLEILRADLDNLDEERNKRVGDAVRKFVESFSGGSPLPIAPKETAKLSPFMEFMKKP